MSSVELPASALGIGAPSHRQHAEQVQTTMQQTSSTLMPVPANPSGCRPAGSHPQEGPSHLVVPALQSIQSEAAGAAQTAPRQEGSVGIGSRQASVPSPPGGVPTVQPPAERQPPAATSGQSAAAAAAWQAHHSAQDSTVQGAQLLQPAQQSSQALPQTPQGPDLRNQVGKPTLDVNPGAQAAAPPALGGAGALPSQPRAAARMIQPGVLSSGEGAVDRGRAGPALPLQGSIPRAAPLTGSAPGYGREPMGGSTPKQEGQQAKAQGGVQAAGLEGMLGRAAPDSDSEEESAASTQDRQRFMQSLQSPDQGASRSRNLAKGFGRMKAKAKDMLQVKNAGSPLASASRAAQQGASQGLPGEGASIPRDAELGKRGRLARDMNMLFAGLKKPSSQQ